MKALVLAILFLALLPTSALARPATVDEALYFGQIQGMTAILSPSLGHVSELLGNADPLDPEWQVNLISETRLWSAIYAAHQTLEVPPAFAEFDGHFSDALRLADLAAQSYEVSIYTQSASDARLANSYLSDATDSLALANAALPDLDFSTTGSSSDANDKETGSSSGKFMDAPCDREARSSAEVTATDSMIQLRGENAGMICFDLPAAQWSITLHCNDDPSGLGEFGTSEADSTPLFPNSTEIVNYADPIEAKLLVTCLRGWSFEAVNLGPAEAS